MILLLLFSLLLSSHVASPSAFPLAVRSPYLNCWLHYDHPIANQTWPATSNRSQTLGWSVLVRVDGLTYSFLGDGFVVEQVQDGFTWTATGSVPEFGGSSPNDGYGISNVTVTDNSSYFMVGPTQTTLAGHAGPMQVNITFFSPIEPRDLLRQSIPFSYLSFTANSSDNRSHTVQVYSGVSGEWNSGDRKQNILWYATPNANVVFHSVKLQTPGIFTEILDQAQWGWLYYAMKAGDDVTYQISSDADSRGNFTSNGKLNDKEDPNLSSIINNSAVFAISRDLGSIQATKDPVVWAIGYTTDSAINYSDLSGTLPTSRSPYYKTQYSTDEEMIVEFLNDFSNASSRALQRANKIFEDSQSITDDLTWLTSVALAEVYGSMQLTVGNDENNNPNKSDVMMFMKNIGGVKKNRVNAVETMYAAFPGLMYLDPSLGALLLEPLFRFQASPNYTIGYAAADLGTNYPNVSGINSNHTQGVEQTGNMLIMTYAYSCASGDGSLISKYYSLLSSWANYLNSSTLFTTNQASADNLTVNNQTNLAIKGIIAIKAMSEMASALNRTDDATKYTYAAKMLYAQWRKLALGSDMHLLAAYGQTNSWTLGYNLFVDVWLDINLVEPSVYAGHSSFIDKLVFNSNFSTFGMPIDDVSTDTNITVSSWSSFVAAMAIAKNQGLGPGLIERLYKRMSTDSLPGVFPVYYDSVNGTSLQGVASPAQGAVFAPLALNMPMYTITLDGTKTPKTKPSSKKRNWNMGTIVGSTIGGVAAIFVVIGIVAFLKRRRMLRRSRPRPIFSTDSMDAGPQMIVSPFDPNSFDQHSEILAEQQPLRIGEPEAAMFVHHRLSSSLPAVLPLPQPVAPVPVGLTDKEMARLRSEAFSSPEPHDFHVSALAVNMSEPTSTSESPLNAVTESGESLYDPRRLHLEFESLRREVERLRADGLPTAVTAPPSYAEGDG